MVIGVVRQFILHLALGSICRWCGQVVWAPDLSSSDLKFKNRFDHNMLDLFLVIPGWTPWLAFYIAHWSTSCQMRFLIYLANLSYLLPVRLFLWIAWKVALEATSVINFNNNGSWLVYVCPGADKYFWQDLSLIKWYLKITCPAEWATCPVSVHNGKIVVNEPSSGKKIREPCLATCNIKNYFALHNSLLSILLSNLYHHQSRRIS